MLAACKKVVAPVGLALMILGAAPQVGEFEGYARLFNGTDLAGW